MYKLLLPLLLLLYTPLATAAEEAAGMVVALRGSSVAQNTRVLEQGSPVYAGEVIVADEKSFVVIRLTDGSKLTVRPGSTVEIRTYTYDGGDDDTVDINLLKGGLRVVTGAISKHSPERYTIETPVALMGVRGTEFSIHLCDENLCDAAVNE